MDNVWCDNMPTKIEQKKQIAKLVEEGVLNKSGSLISIEAHIIVPTGLSDEVDNMIWEAFGRAQNSELVVTKSYDNPRTKATSISIESATVDGVDMNDKNNVNYLLRWANEASIMKRRIDSAIAKELEGKPVKNLKERIRRSGGPAAN